MPSPSNAESCSCKPADADAAVVQLAWGLEKFLAGYYATVDNNSTLETEIGTLHFDNLKGLQQQANLAMEALQQLDVPGVQWPQCDFTFPKVLDKPSLPKTSFMLEASLCGAFIGMADYTQSPQVAFLMARIAAGHGFHAAYFAPMGVETIEFMPNGTSLLPAFTPEHVLSSGSAMGQLGQFLNGCLQAPSGPCGEVVVINSLGSTLEQPQPSCSS